MHHLPEVSVDGLVHVHCVHEMGEVRLGVVVTVGLEEPNAATGIDIECCILSTVVLKDLGHILTTGLMKQAFEVFVTYRQHKVVRHG